MATATLFTTLDSLVAVKVGEVAARNEHARNAIATDGQIYREVWTLLSKGIKADRIGERLVLKGFMGKKKSVSDQTVRTYGVVGSVMLTEADYTYAADLLTLVNNFTQNKVGSYVDLPLGAERVKQTIKRVNADASVGDKAKEVVSQLRATIKEAIAAADEANEKAIMAQMELEATASYRIDSTMEAIGSIKADEITDKDKEDLEVLYAHIGSLIGK